jgi:acyl carrier protein
LDPIYAGPNQIFRDVFDDDTVIATPELKADDVAEWDSLSHIRLILAAGSAAVP